MPHIETDILVIGGGAAGIAAAMAAARATPWCLDKSLFGRGRATIMTQMAVSVALGEQGHDDLTVHLADTLAAGRGICNEELSAIL